MLFKSIENILCFRRFKLILFLNKKIKIILYFNLGVLRMENVDEDKSNDWVAILLKAYEERYGKIDLGE